MDMMADLVSKHDLDFLRREFLQERVAQQHPPGATESCQSRVGLLCFAAEVQPVDSFYP